ncbi:TolC family protein [Pseudomonadales bacterium]|nr:TolC family protein [Pseudomonadales bacterium]
MKKKSTSTHSLPWMRAMLVIAATSSILGCASFATNNAKNSSQGSTTNSAIAITPAAALAHRVLIDDETPLSADKAVQIALINNQNLAAVYAELGFAKAEVFAGARIRNPLLSFSQLDSNAGIDQIVWGISTSLTDLITLRSRKKLAATQALAIEQKVQAYAMATQAQTYQHYYQYLASKQRLQVFEEISAISDLILETTQRYSDAGNVTALELAEAKIQSSEAKLALLNARAAVLVARTKMSEVLGVRASQNWQIAKQLPIPNKASLYPTDGELGKIPARDTLLRQALKQRLDLQAAQTKIAALTLQLKSHSLENKVGDIELGAEREREADGERLTGPNVEWEVPLFSQGQEDQLKINAELEVAQAQLRQLVLELDNAIALALAGRENSANKIIQYQNHLLPAQANAVARTQEEQFFMLIGVFEVMQSKKHQYESFLGLVDAVEEYWLSSTALAKAVGVSPKVFIDQSYNGSRGLEDYLQSDPGTDSPKKSHKHQHHGMHKPQPGPARPTHANHNPAPDNHASHKNHTQSASAKP